MKYFPLIILLFFFSACYEPAKVALPDIAAKDLKGNALDWKKYEGKTVFVHFWATWCKDCLKELPAIKSAYEGLSSEDKQKIAMIFLSDEDTTRLNAYLSSHPLPFEMYQSQKTNKEMGVEYIPQTHVFSADGKLITNRVGANKWTKQKLLGFIH